MTSSILERNGACDNGLELVHLFVLSIELVVLFFGDGKVISLLNVDPMSWEGAVRGLLRKNFSDGVCFTFPKFKNEVVINLHLRNVELLFSLRIVSDVVLDRRELFEQVVLLHHVRESDQTTLKAEQGSV